MSTLVMQNSNCILEYKSANVEPDERLKLATEIYDTFVMRELLVRQRRKDSSINQSPDSSPPAIPHSDAKLNFPGENNFQGNKFKFKKITQGTML